MTLKSLYRQNYTIRLLNGQQLADFELFGKISREQPGDFFFCASSLSLYVQTPRVSLIMHFLYSQDEFKTNINILLSASV